jgi:hypothetical protein
VAQYANGRTVRKITKRNPFANELRREAKITRISLHAAVRFPFGCTSPYPWQIIGAFRRRRSQTSTAALEPVSASTRLPGSGVLPPLGWPPPPLVWPPPGETVVVVVVLGGGGGGILV